MAETKIWYLVVQEPYLSMLKSRLKRKEGRRIPKPGDNLDGIQIGDIIEFSDGQGHSFQRVVKDLTFYRPTDYSDPLRAMLETAGVTDMLPDLTWDQMDHAIEIYEGFLKAQKIKEQGMMVIHL